MVGIEFFSSLECGIRILSFLSLFLFCEEKTEFIPSALSVNLGSLPAASLPG